MTTHLSDAASKGGKARAEKLSPEARKEIAIKAATARWGGELPQATHDGTLVIGDKEISCAVLEDGTRLVSQETFLIAIGRSRKGKGGQVAISADGLPPFLAADRLKPLVSHELRQATVPVVYLSVAGRKSFGYSALLLPMVCELYLKARDEGITTRQQEHIVQACDLLTRALARVGIVALVDEATGYQEDRARNALAEILETFISDELRKWVKTFPDEYFSELARLRGINLHNVSVKRPQYIGHLTNNLVYARLAPGVKQELQKLTPKAKKGNRKHCFHQRLTEDSGHPKLREHLASVIALMRACDDWKSFQKLLDRALPKFKEMPLFDNIGDMPSKPR